MNSSFFNPNTSTTAGETGFSSTTNAPNSEDTNSSSFIYDDSSDVEGEGNYQEGFKEFAKVRNEGMQANLALLVETGICRINASASLVALPNSTTFSVPPTSDQVDPLPASAREIFMGATGLQQPTTSNNSSTSMFGSNPSNSQHLFSNPEDAQFLQDNWYFLELHQSILQESTQRR